MYTVGVDPNSHRVISVSSGPVFKFSGFVKMIDPFCDRSTDVAMAVNFVAKFATLADHTLIRHIGVLKRIEGTQFRIQMIKWQLPASSSYPADLPSKRHPDPLCRFSTIHRTDTHTESPTDQQLIQATKPVPTPAYALLTTATRLIMLKQRSLIEACPMSPRRDENVRTSTTTYLFPVTVNLRRPAHHSPPPGLRSPVGSMRGGRRGRRSPSN